MAATIETSPYEMGDLSDDDALEMNSDGQLTSEAGTSLPTENLVKFTVFDVIN